MTPNPFCFSHDRHDERFVFRQHWIIGVEKTQPISAAYDLRRGRIVESGKILNSPASLVSSLPSDSVQVGNKKKRIIRIAPIYQNMTQIEILVFFLNAFVIVFHYVNQLQLYNVYRQICYQKSPLLIPPQPVKIS